MLYCQQTSKNFDLFGATMLKLTLACMRTHFKHSAEKKCSYIFRPDHLLIGLNLVTWNLQQKTLLKRVHEQEKYFFHLQKVIVQGDPAEKAKIDSYLSP